MRDTQQDDFLNSARLCLLFWISTRSIYRWEKKNELPLPVRINGRKYWRRSEIFEWFSKRSK